MPELMVADKSSPSAVTVAGAFETTLWSVVLHAGDRSSPRAREALETLCSTYWYPLYAFLRRTGHSPHDAQDLTQSFFTHLLERNSIERADPQRGRFRSFLLGALCKFVADEADKARAQKRGGGCPLISLDAELAEERFHLEPADEVDPRKLYERRWAMALLERVFTRLRKAYADKGKEALYHRLQVYLREGKDGGRYADAAAELGIEDGTVKVEVLRMRRAFRDLFRDEIKQTIGSSADLEDEIRHLRVALA